jgi:tripartite-type tricarboxylate transporter receptor subunit TctC
MKRLGVLVIAILCGLGCLPAAALDYPERTVRIIVPMPPGGGPDMLARTIADRLSPSWGQPIIVENRPGAGTVLGVKEVLSSPADGYTILVTDCATVSVTPLLYKELPFKPSDLAPVTQLVKFYQVMLANPQLPANNLSELVVYAKANPGKLSYGSYGIGSQAHLSAELFKHAAGIEMQHVPYKGADSLVGAIRGDVQIGFAGLIGARATTEAGQLKALAIGGPTRNPLMPNVATFAEQGYPSVDTKVDFGVFVRRGTPRDIIDRISRDFSDAVKAPDYQKKYLDPVAFEPVGSSPDQFAAFLIEDAKTRREAVEIAHIQPTD